MGLVLVGYALWDLGWHSSIHHKDLWLANPLVRVVGVAIALAGVVSTAGVSWLPVNF